MAPKTVVATVWYPVIVTGSTPGKAAVALIVPPAKLKNVCWPVLAPLFWVMVTPVR